MGYLFDRSVILCKAIYGSLKCTLSCTSDNSPFLGVLFLAVKFVAGDVVSGENQTPVSLCIESSEAEVWH